MALHCIAIGVPSDSVHTGRGVVNVTTLPAEAPEPGRKPVITAVLYDVHAVIAIIFLNKYVIISK
jgi:hypothetical protein